VQSIPTTSHFGEGIRLARELNQRMTTVLISTETALPELEMLTAIGVHVLRGVTIDEGARNPILLCFGQSFFILQAAQEKEGLRVPSFFSLASMDALMIAVSKFQ